MCVRILSLVKFRSPVALDFEAGGDWSIEFGKLDGIKFSAAVFGECWLSVESVPAPIRVTAGDCLLLPHGKPFRVCSDLALTPVDAFTVLPIREYGSTTIYNGGGDFLSVGGHFTIAGDHADILLGVLPPVLHFRKEMDRAVLRWTLERMQQELREPQPGGFLVAQQLAYVLLVQSLRLHLVDGAHGGVGWLFALADQRMRAALCDARRSRASVDVAVVVEVRGYVANHIRRDV